jgi:hypothetical protein
MAWKKPVRGWFKIDKETGVLVQLNGEPKEKKTFIVNDELPEPLESMADGKMYTTKTALRASYKRRGLEEVGNMKPESYVKKPEGPPIEEYERDVAVAYVQVRDGMAPLTEPDRERCKIINKQLRDSYDQRVRDPDRTD